jgi:DNA-binding winged helix-turn-helix (wHTH) protein
VWTYETLFAAVWGGTYLGDNSILHSAVKRLRRKLREVGLSVETVRGIGYRFVAPGV